MVMKELLVRPFFFMLSRACFQGIGRKELGDRRRQMRNGILMILFVNRYFRSPTRVHASVRLPANKLLIKSPRLILFT
jgi:hypothetical protein